MTNIRKAILPVAGLGTRFLPATKAIPKEMLPIVDIPLIEYAVDEAISIGVDEIIFVTSPDKYSIKTHFERSKSLENKLLKKGKSNLVEKINPNKYNSIEFHFIAQEEQIGLGHAISLAADYVIDEPFAVILPDDLFVSEVSCIKELSEAYFQTKNSVVAVNKIDSNQIHKYGVIKPGKINKNLIEIDDIVEKPNKNNAPSDIAVCGRYILTPDIFDFLKLVKEDKSGEIQLTDAIRLMAKEEPISALLYSGKKFDCGSKLGYVQAIISNALSDNEIKEDIKKFIKSIDWTFF